MANPIKRETATICMIEDILGGNFVKTEGWTPSYFETSIGNISRANILGVIVSIDGQGLLLDDGSGKMLLRSFDGKGFDSFTLGDFVIVIGRPRLYNDQKYIMPEIIKKIDPAWSILRKVEIEIARRGAVPINTPVRVTVSEPIPPTANHYQKIFAFIRDLDAGDGAPTEEVIKRSGIPKADEMIKTLIEEGEIFEIRAGKLKILE